MTDYSELLGRLRTSIADTRFPMTPRAQDIGGACDAIETLTRELAEARAEIECQKATVKRVQAAAKTLETTRCEVYNHYVNASKINTEAVATLDSERAANAMLTEGNDTLRAELTDTKARLAEAVDLLECGFRQLDYSD